ncbi:acyl-CoA synthetase [Piscinibacter koreensis]|uniref:Acyl-CoA synthetase n=1 Tax=Piscinibacter koreensis TaxID=2742824 RepID=A0A7Y6NLS2_9BURK|nr:acyl-CoA synthetase [Schlegelella koreensis]NUZ05454.1 acyl-CoA synthetase [Schlegelella koreensis]
MKAREATSPPARWTEHRERGSLVWLRAMRNVAIALGRPGARLLLHPIALYFVLAAGAARRESRRYLARALGRRPTALDVYRHFHAFASTVLDRVYLLQERFEQFDVHATGIRTILDPFERGDGALLFGAHVGSFEALRAIGHEHGLRVAMVMYEDNARLINETLAALAPDASLHTIGLGKVDAMIALKRWLDDGGVAGLLADRTLPVQSARSRNVRVPFLGSPATFSDGPFRLAAMLRRPVVFMAGIYRGGRAYELRFAQIADFSATPPAERDAAIRAGLERYVATLEALCREAPYNWFNFFDFWAFDETAAEPASDAAG